MPLELLFHNMLTITVSHFSQLTLFTANYLDLKLCISNFSLKLSAIVAGQKTRQPTIVALLFNRE